MIVHEPNFFDRTAHDLLISIPGNRLHSIQFDFVKYLAE